MCFQCTKTSMGFTYTMHNTEVNYLYILMEITEITQFFRKVCNNMYNKVNLPAEIHICSLAG